MVCSGKRKATGDLLTRKKRNESALPVDLVTGSQAVRRPIGRPCQKTPAMFVLPQCHVCEAEARSVRVSAEIPRVMLMLMSWAVVGKGDMRSGQTTRNKLLSL